MKLHENPTLFRQANVWEQLRKTYTDDFRKLVFGEDFPDEAVILSRLREISSRLQLVEWNVKID